MQCHDKGNSQMPRQRQSGAAAACEMRVNELCAGSRGAPVKRRSNTDAAVQLLANLRNPRYGFGQQNGIIREGKRRGDASQPDITRRKMFQLAYLRGNKRLRQWQQGFLEDQHGRLLEQIVFHAASAIRLPAPPMTSS